MPAIKLRPLLVEKPWGCAVLPAMFDEMPVEEPVGEIWFVDPDDEDRELLIKYLFTSERLSIQVHPDDDAAHAAGYPRGKDEAWLVLAAEEDAHIGVGLVHEVSKATLEQSALDGSIEQLVDWRHVRTGDFFYSPAGTIHAIGAGLMLLEVQQNLDLTYRLYDYGRPRELHLDEGIKVSRAKPHLWQPSSDQPETGREILVSSDSFTMERLQGPRRGILRHDAPLWVIPVEGSGRIGNDALEPGSVWICDGESEAEFEAGAQVILAYQGPSTPKQLFA